MRRNVISLVVPSYRRGEKIVPTVRSALDQTRKLDEIIVVNDGGAVETREAIAQFGNAVRLLDVVHGGAAAARNHGVAAAEGDVVVLLDDDDMMRPDAVEILVAGLEVFYEAGASFADHSFTNLVTGEHSDNNFHGYEKHRRILEVEAMKVNGTRRLLHRGLYRALLHGNLLGQPWAVRRDVYLGLGGFAVGLGSADDWELYLRLTRTYPVCVCDQVVSDHFQEVGKTHLTTGSGQEEKQAAALMKHLSELPWWDVSPRLVLSKRLAGYWKRWGDTAMNRRRRWQCYSRSARLWPFDAVVLARAIAWTPGALAAPRDSHGVRDASAMNDDQVATEGPRS